VFYIVYAYEKHKRTYKGGNVCGNNCRFVTNHFTHRPRPLQSWTARSFARRHAMLCASGNLFNGGISFDGGCWTSCICRFCRWDRRFAQQHGGIRCRIYLCFFADKSCTKQKMVFYCLCNGFRFAFVLYYSNNMVYDHISKHSLGKSFILRFSFCCSRHRKNRLCLFAWQSNRKTTEIHQSQIKNKSVAMLRFFIFAYLVLSVRVGQAFKSSPAKSMPCCAKKYPCDAIIAALSPQYLSCGKNISMPNFLHCSLA